MCEITIAGLISRFEERMRQSERHHMGETTGKEPKFPMIVMFLGNEAIKGAESVASRLTGMWPQYSGEMFFLGVDENSSDLEFTNLKLFDGKFESEVLSSAQLGDKITSLFGLNSHFVDKSRLLIYYVLDTTGLQDVSDYQHWTKIMKEVKSSYVDRTIRTMEMQIVLLNEGFGDKRRVSAGVRNCIAQDKANIDYSILLLSNRRSDYTILENWDMCYRIIARAIAITNNDETQITTTLFSKNVFTVAFAGEDKPTSEIAQTIIKGLMEPLSRINFEEAGPLLEDAQIASKLGLSDEGTLKLLDEYAEENLIPMLPTEKQLSLFPRWENVIYPDLPSFTAKEFNDFTMNGWNAYLEQIMNNVQEKVTRDKDLRSEWSSKYRRQLADIFTINELIWLRDNIEDVKKFLSNVQVPSEGSSVLTAAKSRIKYLLCTNRELMSVFEKTIVDLGNDAEEFSEHWSSLQRSGLNVHAVRNENITQFYNRRIRSFFDSNEYEISQEFIKITSMEELDVFFDEIIGKIIDSDPVFSMNFEDELEARLHEEAALINARQYIRERLTGENVPVYYQAVYALDAPVASTVLINTKTKLYDNMKAHLPDVTYYYNTGNGNFAETLNFLSISDSNLVAEEA